MMNSQVNMLRYNGTRFRYFLKKGLSYPTFLFLIFLLLALPALSAAQSYDLLLKGGHEWEPYERAVADVAVFVMREGDFGFVDSRGNLKPGDRKLETELTIREGAVVYDLNGLAATNWDE